MDDASSALIAQMLAEDNEYAMATGAFDEEDEDSEGDLEMSSRSRKRKRGKKSNNATTKGKKATKAPKSKGKVPDQKSDVKDSAKAENGSEERSTGNDSGEASMTEKENESSNSSSGVNIASGDGKKKKAAPRKWTEEEEEIFLRGLDLHGRDWKAISALLNGSRLGRDVASHAQKHFIRLYKENKALPDKVRESGEGYTLSGKPLDPNSAAARAYGVGGVEQSVAYREERAAAAAILGSGTLDPLPVSQRSLEEVNADFRAKAVAKAEAKAEAAERARIAAAAKIESAARKKREREEEIARKKQAAWEKQQAKRQQLYGEDGRTDYSRSRSRRKAATRFETNLSEALQFVRVTPYQGPVASGPKSQPFHVNVLSNVYATVDLHAHTSTAEIMGLLAGKWDASKLSITVEKAFPGRSMLDGATECEMDPVVEVMLRDEITAQGLTVVGWYHSHPTFECVPSSCDISNQTNYQALFRDEASGMEPFLGLIMTPYDQRLPSERSQYSWFYVESPRSSKSPKRIEAESVCEARLPEDALSRMKKLVDEAADAQEIRASEHSVQFASIWRSSTGEEADITFATKLRKAMEAWMPPTVFRLDPSSSTSFTEEEGNGHSEYAKCLLDDLLLKLQAN